MFRRTTKEEDTDMFNKPNESAPKTNEGGLMSGDSTTTAAQPSSAIAASTTSAQPVASVGSVTASAQAAPAVRATTDTRPAQAPNATTFRPSSAPISSMGTDMSRTRMPETKASPAPSLGVSVDKSAKGSRRVLTVGNDILLKGEIATCDRLVIEGKVDATLNDVHTVEIAETGSFKGSANIEDAEISGLFEGDLVVRNRLVIYATGKVRGKISYGEIEIERGGELTGEIKTTSPTATSTGPRPTRAKIDDKVAA